MRAYNYFLFRIYVFFRDVVREKNDTIFFKITVFSSVFIFINVFTLSAIITNYHIDNILPNKYYIVPYMMAIFGLNYYLFIKRRSFLDYNFKTDRKGGLLVIIYMIFTVTSFILVANENRSRIEQKHPETIETDTTRGSLEKDIEDWFKKK